VRFGKSHPAGAALAALCFSTLAACGGAREEEAAAPAPSEEADSLYGEGAFADMMLGDPQAPVTVIEYASVTCPVCAVFHQAVFPEFKAKYIDTGKVKFVFREFPAHNPQLTFAGSMVARCAAGKGGNAAYFAVVNKMFETQEVWAEGDNPRRELQKIAMEAGMDEAAFEACIRREDLLDLLNRVAGNARDEYGVGGTPSFFINGAPLTNGWALKDFDQAIEQASPAAD